MPRKSIKTASASGGFTARVFSSYFPPCFIGASLEGLGYVWNHILWRFIFFLTLKVLSRIKYFDCLLLLFILFIPIAWFFGWREVFIWLIIMICDSSANGKWEEILHLSLASCFQDVHQGLAKLLWEGLISGLYKSLPIPLFLQFCCTDMRHILLLMHWLLFHTF